MNKKTRWERWDLIAVLIVTLFLGACAEKNVENIRLYPSTSSSPEEAALKADKGKDQNASGETEKELASPAQEAKRKLEEGNLRFVLDRPGQKDISIARRKNLSEQGQKPFAVILSCSDSRVPPEVLFDQALGDLFVIRDAGNVADAIVMGSIEYGAEHLHAPLIVVMGHSQCGAVKATLEGGSVSPNIQSIIQKIRPSYEQVLAKQPDEKKVLDLTIEQNIRNSIKQVQNSHVIMDLAEEKKVSVLGAKYDMDSGKVEFLN